ncbi:MAG TPA: histidine phosphatase family protein [Anaerolineaceae bacterium]|nr:histidine phosphatase family protein [Anaerolineaceae bacterium]
MRIGLIRHFPVIHPYTTQRWMTSREYQGWLQAYDSAGIRYQQVNLRPEDWQICYSSDISRALETARHIYPGEIQVTPLLREISVNPMFDSVLRLPFSTWDALSHLAWFFSHRSQREGRDQVMERIRTFLSNALPGLARQDNRNGPKNILVVSHGGLMWYLRAELLRLGFWGERFTRAEHGRLYVFEMPD